jgi:hypothetical protein
VRLIFKLLLLNALIACGAPGSDAVFGEKAKTPVGNAPVTKAPVPAPPQIVSRQFRGWYRRMDDTSQFQPCGAKAPLNVRGTPTGQAQLRERYRFAAPWQGAKMFSVFLGAIATDTVKASDDSTRTEITTRFLITGVDSMRAWRSTDCSGSRTP